MKNTTKTSWGLGKRALACACSAALGVALLPAAAFAADAGTGAAAGAGTGGSGASGDPVISVSIKDAKTGSVVPIKKARYTQAQLDEMAAQNTGAKNYVYMSKGAPKVVSTDKYVTLGQLLKPVGDKWADGSTISFSGQDGFGADTQVTYKDATTSYYYPEGTASGPAGTAEATSTVIGLDEAEGTLGGESTVSDVAGSFTAASYTTGNAPRVYSGIASNDAAQAEYPMGRGFVSNVSKITVTYPHQDFKVVARDADSGEETPIATYTDEQLADLAKANTKYVSYLYKSDVCTATSYVTLDQLIGKDQHWLSTSSVEVNTPDNFVTTFTYADATAKRYFYPESTSATPSAAGAVEVSPVIALKYKKGALSGTSTAQDIATASLQNKDESGTPRFFIGDTDANDILAGKFSPQNVTTVTIVYHNYKALYENAKAQLDQAEQDLATANAAKTKAEQDLATANAAKTKAEQDLAKAQAQVAKLSKKANTVKVAKSKVTVKKGRKATVKVTKAKGKVTVKSSKTKVAKVTYKNGKVTIKGAKKGKATVTVKAAGTSKYKTGTKTIKVTVK